MYPKRALLTGFSGFLGSYLLSAMKAEGLAVQTLGRTAGASISCNLSNGVPKLVSPVSLVVHAAGKAHSIPRNEEEEAEFFGVNIGGTKNLCAAFDKIQVWPEAFVFISTVAVYGLEKGENVVEEYPLSGSTPYAKSKIAAEVFLQEWCALHRIRLSILRLPLIAGSNPPGNLEAMIKGIQTGRYFNIGGGKAQKSIVLATDVAKWLPKIANTGGIYNLTDGIHPSFANLASLIARQSGKKEPSNIPLWVAKMLALVGNILGGRVPINTDKLQKMTTTLTFDDTKARQAFGWKPQKVLDSFVIN